MRRPRIDPTLALLVLLWHCSPFVAAEATAQLADEATLADSIEALEERNEFTRALEFALQRQSLLQSADTDAWRLGDAQRRAQTLRRIVAMSPEQRAALDQARHLTREAHEAADARDFERAQRSMLEAVRIERELFAEHTRVAEALDTYGALQARQGRYADAEPYCREALAMRRAVLGTEHPDVALNYDNLASLMWFQGKQAGAEEYCGEALRIRRTLYESPHSSIASSISHLGLVLGARGRHDEAAARHREALEMRRQLHPGAHAEIAESILHLANIRRLQGRFALSEELHRGAFTMRQELLGPKHPNTAIAANDLGLVLWKRGRFLEAEEMFRLASAINREHHGDKHPELAQTLANVALVLDEQGAYAEAEQLIREALEMRRESLGDQHPKIASSLNNLAWARLHQGDAKAAERLFREALEVRRQALDADHPMLAFTLNNVGVALLRQGDLEGAEEAHRQAYEQGVARKGPHAPDVTSYMHQWATALRGLGRDDEARDLYEQALAIRLELFENEHPLVAATLTELGALAAARGDLEQARPYLERAAASYEAARHRTARELGRQLRFAPPYARLAEVLLRAGDPSAAWHAMERSLSASLSELMIRSHARTLSEADEMRQDSLAADLTRCEKAVAALARAQDRDAALGREAISSARQDLAHAQVAWAGFQNQMSRSQPIREGQSATLHDIQSSLDESTAIVGWLDIPAHEARFAGFRAAHEDPDATWSSWAYVMRHDGDVHWMELETANASRIRALRRAVANSNTGDVAVVAAQLYDERFKPFEPYLANVERLIVIPLGMMAGVPVEVLQSQGKLVGERFVVTYTPSATIHSWLAQQSPVPSVPALLVGDPPFADEHVVAMSQETADDDFAMRGALPEAQVRSVLAHDPDDLSTLRRLTASRAEIQAIRQVFAPDARLLAGEAASEQTLVEMCHDGSLARFGTLHFATHALVDDARPSRSALVLSQIDLPNREQQILERERVYYGLVTVADVAREWHLEADLVTLSACETGLGKPVGGEGYVGFAQAFLVAGARSVLVSLWKVNDRATALLMQRFYENRIQRGLSKAQALSEAKGWLRRYEWDDDWRPFEHPYFWSGFILVGDPR